VEGNIVVRGGGGLKNIACDTSWPACVVAVLIVMYTGLSSDYSVNFVGTSTLNTRTNLRLGVKDRYNLRSIEKYEKHY